MIRILLAAAAAALPATEPAASQVGEVRSGENRAWSGRVELEGPLEEVELNLGAEGRTRILVPLARGERRVLDVPLGVRIASAHPEPGSWRALEAIPLPEASFLPASTSGGVRALSWSPVQPGGDVEALVELRSRPRPVPRSPRPSARLPELLLAAAACVLASAWRGRPGRALLAGILGAAACAALVGGRPLEPGGILVVEGDLEEGTWLEVESALGRLDLSLRKGGAGAPRGVAWLEVEPEGVEVTWTVFEKGGGLRAAATAQGSRLHHLRPIRAPEMVPGGEAGEGIVSRFGEVRGVWMRAAEGAWTFHRLWEPGDPGPAEPGAPPKAWLSAGLPAGRDVLVARLDVPGERWLRVTGSAAESVRRGGGSSERRDAAGGGY